MYIYPYPPYYPPTTNPIPHPQLNITLYYVSLSPIPTLALINPSSDPTNTTMMATVRLACFGAAEQFLFTGTNMPKT